MLFFSTFCLSKNPEKNYSSHKNIKLLFSTLIIRNVSWASNQIKASSCQCQVTLSRKLLNLVYLLQQKPRQNPSRYPALESISDNRLVRPALNVIQPLNSGAGNPATPPGAKVKNPVSHFTGTELQPLQFHRFARFSKLRQNSYSNKHLSGISVRKFRTSLFWVPKSVCVAFML